jgi:hypothetical protein
MTPFRFLFALVALAAWPAFAWALDLARIPRTIHKEPVYRGKPRYCLLVFGPQAKTRVWLVQDGDTMYVDRNGNGDLTEPGKKVAADKRDGAAEGEYNFKVGDIRDGPRLHKQLYVAVAKLDHLANADKNIKALLAKDPKTRGYCVWIDMEIRGWQGAAAGGRVHQGVICADATGALQFAGRPQDAPIIHFGGPWQVTFIEPFELVIGRERDAVLGVGTPGLGPGTTAFIAYEGVIPETAYPTLEITFPPGPKGKAAVPKKWVLKRRC